MTALLDLDRPDAASLTHPALTAAISEACGRIAPLWPLGAFVAVNPFLGFTGQSFESTCALLRRVAGVDALAPRAFHREAIAAGLVEDADLAAALGAAPADRRPPGDVAALRAAAVRDPAPAPTSAKGAVVATVAETLDRLAGGDRQASRTAFMVDEISRWCAAWFDEGQAVWRPAASGAGFYADWREAARSDLNPEIMGVKGFRATVRAAPADPVEAIGVTLAALGVPERAWADYLHRALFDIGGWAAYVRRLVFESDLRGRADDRLVQLLAVRVVWGYALFRQRRDAVFVDAWRAAMAAAAMAPRDTTLGDDPEFAVDLVLQDAYERAWRRRLFRRLTAGGRAAAEGAWTRPHLQAAFCIDVRSEVYRRALETAWPGVETLGVAGFFGVAIAYAPLGDARGRAQCPVLLTPATLVCETVADASPATEKSLVERRRLGRVMGKAWKGFKRSAVSSFAYVEAAGLLAAGRIVTESLGASRLDTSTVGWARPDISPGNGGGFARGFTLDQRVETAQGLLRALSLRAPFARLVLLAGHGSTSVNNPHASGLDCGACGGQTGEPNARVAAAILNDPAVRAALREHGAPVDDDTWFLAALHDTTTDEVRLFDTDAAPATHAQDIARLRARLDAASRLARVERAARLGLAADSRIDAKVAARGRDWSQVRPEWGLAGAAAFIAAPREATAGVDLEGRVFLHSYDWRRDEGFAVLELIMTAPMVVASWITLQYYASTVNNRAFGAGDKVLHNIVGGIGVLEGNGGDLKVGLPWQSVHDGIRFAHEPIRLHALIAAPLEALNAVIARQPGVRDLVDNGWVHLFAMGDGGVVTHRYAGDLTWEAQA